MLNETKTATLDPPLLIGEVSPLARQLGSPEELVSLAAASILLRHRAIDSLSALRAFLSDYQQQVLVPVELPAICRAFHHAARGEGHDLITLDRELARLSAAREFAVASACVGRNQLRRLRPLRDQRWLQRYLRTVEDGEAHGWHTVVYGIALALYSLPLRQGLAGYARQTLSGFIGSASRSLALSDDAKVELLEEVCGALPEAIEAVIVERAVGQLSVV
jgi:urease accessory protein UreF